MNTRNLQKCRIAGVACLAVLLVYLAAGCQTVSTSGQSNPAQTGETKTGAVTFYGIVNRGQVQAVRLPFAVQISAWLVREGEQVADQRALLQLDLEPLRQKYRDLERQQKKLRGTAEVLQAQANWTGQRIAAVQAALQVDLEPGLDSLDKWYRATSRTRRSQYAAELRLFLTSLESLDLYGSLLTLTRDADQVEDLARPQLMRRQAELSRQLDEHRLESMHVRQLLLENQLDQQALDAELDPLTALLDGTWQTSLGRVDTKGRLLYSGGPVMVDTLPADRLTAFPADEPLMILAETAVHSLTIHVEEQLVPQVVPGAPVLISPLFDRTQAWTGVVAQVSAKADIINGETVVAVLVTTEADLPGAGYTVIAKVLPVNG